MIVRPIFLASRFQEFSDVRSALCQSINGADGWNMRAVDLNDDAVSGQSVWQRCKDRIEQSDLMVLLLGDTYGEPMPGSELSYTRLEYEHACRLEGRPEVLVFGLGTCYDAATKSITFSKDPRLAKWQDQVNTNHIVGYPQAATPEETAQKILSQVKDALHRQTDGQASERVEDDLDFADVSVDDAAHDSADYLDARAASLRGVQLVDETAETDLLATLQRPAAVAAREQLLAAQQDISLKDFPLAIRHLQCALEHQPENVMASYWLAKLYFTTGRKERLNEIIKLVRRAARRDEVDRRPFRQALSLILASQATSVLGNNFEPALEYARQAVKAAPNFAQAHIEVARQLLNLGQLDAALSEVRTAFHIYPPSLRDVQRDPHFDSIQARVSAWRREVRLKAVAAARAVLEVEEYLQEEISPAELPVTIPDSASVTQAYQVARASASRQHDMLCATASRFLTRQERAAGQLEALRVAQEELRRAVWLWKQATPTDVRWQGVTIDADVPARRIPGLLARLLKPRPTPVQPVTPSGQLWGVQTANGTVALEERVRGWQRRVTELEGQDAARAAAAELQALAALIRRFEDGTVAADQMLLPFPGPARARPGMLVRCPSNCRQVTADGQPKAVRMVEDPRSPLTLQPADVSLFRCLTVTSDTVTLCHAAAYLTVGPSV